VRAEEEEAGRLRAQEEEAARVLAEERQPEAAGSPQGGHHDGCCSSSSSRALGGTQGHLKESPGTSEPTPWEKDALAGQRGTTMLFGASLWGT